MDSFVTGSAVYVVTWWLVLFIALPFGVRAPSDDELEPGQERGAPVKPMMWRKIAVTTVVTTLLWIVFYYISAWDLISFRPN